MVALGAVKRFILMSFVSILAGCASLSVGPTPVSETTTDRLEPLRHAIQARCLNLEGPGREDPLAARNRLVTAYMFAVDEGYRNYERDLLNNVRTNNFGVTLASLIASTVGSLSRREHITRLMAGTNTLLTGGQAAISEEILLNQSFQVLQSQMRSSRAAQRALILERLPVAFESWDFCLALSDAVAYEQAGTLTAALVELAETTAEESRINEARAEAAIPRVGYERGNLARALRSYFAPAEESIMTARIRQAQALLTAANISVPSGMTVGERLSQILSDQLLDTERRALAVAILQAEQDEAAKAEITRALSQ